MPIFIYNSLARAKVEFIPQNPPKVNIYTCGVTVYDESHLGHARSLYTFDVIRRYLEYRGFRARFVRNITDIDDKIINRANELKIDWKGLVKKYIARYYQDLKALGIKKADCEPRATENIPDMVKYIKSLVDKGYAYEAGGDVYFAVRKFPDYGKLSNQSIDQMETGVRIEPTEFKKDPLDFALWKKSKEGEPSWNSPWGKGRPGWHIECSVMSQKFLKTKTLDIHAGGMDLIFPHHENEIAQAEALSGKPFAKYWIHHGLLTINGQKMAKSLGNFVTIKDVLRDYPPELLKVFYLQAHYSSPIDFSENKLEEVKNTTYDLLKILKDINFDIKDFSKMEVEEKSVIDNGRKTFEESMDDDFNTPKAWAALYGMVKYCKNLRQEYNDGEFDHLRYPLQYARNVVEQLGAIFGLDVKSFNPDDPRWFDKDKREAIRELTDGLIQAKIDLRAQLKKEKKFDEADRIRNELGVKGIILEDSKGGKTTWRREL